MIESELKTESGAPAHSIHLLDDDSDWLLFLFEYLSNAGYSVTASSTIDEALRLLARSRPEVLIADRDIPELNEIELIDRVRSLSPATRVILTTERSRSLLRPEAVDLLAKPIDGAGLLWAVERIMQDGRLGRQPSQS